MTKVGDRVGAIRNADAGNVYFYGYGIYDGMMSCPYRPFGMTVAEYEDIVRGTFSDADAATINRALDFKNPRITLDDERGVVYGLQCWWGSEEKIKAMLEGKNVIYVDVEKP